MFLQPSAHGCLEWSLQSSTHGCLESGPWLLPEFMLTWQTGDSSVSGCKETRKRQERHVWLKGLAEAATCQVGPDKSPGPLQVRGAGAVRPLQMLRERSMCTNRNFS